MKNFVVKACMVVLVLVVLTGSALLYWRLDKIPYGYHVDEMSGSVAVGCMATEGVDAHNIRYPLFADLHYGTPKPPTYIYPAVLWSKLFGYTVHSLRAFSVTVHLLGIIGLYLLARSLFGWRYAVLTTAVASVSPWAWVLSRVAFESMFSSTFLIWGMYFFFKPPKSWNAVISGLFFIAAIYSYPPFRLQTPLMLLTLAVYSRWKNPWPLKSWLIFAMALILPAIPLIKKTLNGEIQSRFNTISIFSKDYLNSIHSSGKLSDLFGIFMNNFLLHFKWEFLFLRGDPSYVHSTRHFGILSWLDLAALIMGAWWLFMLLIKKYRSNNPLVLQKSYVLFLISNIFIGVIPAALTNSELPNALRITGSWPFVCLLTGFLLWQACERWWGLWVVTCILIVFFAVLFFNVYFKVFPQEGKGMFGYWTLDQANQIKSDDDWLKFLYLYRHEDYNARYFLMQYRGVSCTQSRIMWERLRDLLISRGNY